MFQPSKFKYKKHQKGKNFNKIKITNNLFSYGQIALKALSNYRISSKQLSAYFKFIRIKIKKKGHIVTKLFPQVNVSAKPVEVRMGKGKGGVSFCAVKVRPGAFLFELSSRHKSFCVQVLKEIKAKLPIKTKIVLRR
jgi:large subunit ribosomal protein L16